MAGRCKRAELAGEESGAEDGAEDDGEDAEYGTKSAAKSATFWEGVLRHHHNRLQQAEEAALAQAPAQPRRAAAALADSALPRRGTWSSIHVQLVVALLAHASWHLRA